MSVKFSYPGTIPINDNRIARGYYTVAVFGYPPPPPPNNKEERVSETYGTLWTINGRVSQQWNRLAVASSASIPSYVFKHYASCRPYLMQISKRQEYLAGVRELATTLR